jgi:hypothetical protein
MSNQMSRDERFLAMAKELGFDIYDENSAGITPRWSGTMTNCTSAGWCRE